MALTQEQISKAFKNHFEELGNVLKTMMDKVAIQGDNPHLLAAIERLTAENQ